MRLTAGIDTCFFRLIQMRSASYRVAVSINDRPHIREVFGVRLRPCAIAPAQIEVVHQKRIGATANDQLLRRSDATLATLAAFDSDSICNALRFCAA